jgi:hypothetical protein
LNAEIKNITTESNYLELFKKIEEDPTKLISEATLGKIVGILLGSLPALIINPSSLFIYSATKHKSISETASIVLIWISLLIFPIIFPNLGWYIGDKIVSKISFRKKFKKMLKNWDNHYQYKTPKKIIPYIDYIYSEWMYANSKSKGNEYINNLSNEIRKSVTNLISKKRSLLNKLIRGGLIITASAGLTISNILITILISGYLYLYI